MHVKLNSCRPGVQFQQADGEGSEFAWFTLRLRFHYALREEHVLEGHVLGHNSSDGEPREETP